MIVFFFFWFSWMNESEVASWEGKNGCCVAFGVQASACAPKATRKYIIYSSCVFFPCFFCTFWQVYCVFHVVFFHTIFCCVFAVLFRSVLRVFFYLSPGDTCCLGILYAMSLCFVFVRCFSVLFFCFLAIITCCYFWCCVGRVFCSCCLRRVSCVCLSFCPAVFGSRNLSGNFTGAYLLLAFFCFFLWFLLPVFVVLFLLPKPVVDMPANTSGSLPIGPLPYLVFVSPGTIPSH